MRRSRARDGEDKIAQVRYLTNDGRVLWIESHLTAICDDDGKPVGLRVLDEYQRSPAGRSGIARETGPLAGIIGSAMDPSSRSMSGNEWCLQRSRRENVRLFCTEALGQPLTSSFPPRFRDAHQEHLTHKTDQRRRAFVGSFDSLSGRRAEGEVFLLMSRSLKWNLVEPVLHHHSARTHRTPPNRGNPA